MTRAELYQALEALRAIREEFYDAAAPLKAGGHNGWSILVEAERLILIAASTVADA